MTVQELIDKLVLVDNSLEVRRVDTVYSDQIETVDIWFAPDDKNDSKQVVMIG